MNQTINSQWPFMFSCEIYCVETREIIKEEHRYQNFIVIQKDNNDIFYTLITFEIKLSPSSKKVWPNRLY